MFGGRCPLPSNHSRSGDALISQGLCYRLAEKTNIIREFNDAWFTLESTIDVQRQNLSLSMKNEACDVAFAILKQALSAPFDSELDFDRNLFQALKSCLERSGLVDAAVRSSDNQIILKVDEAKGLAVGIARQTDITRGLRERSGGSVVSVYPDHLVCLFEKETRGNSSWILKDCFSVIEFTKDDETCQDWIANEDTIDLEKKQGVLSQVMSYTIRCVLPYHARRGVKVTNLRWTVIVASLKGQINQVSGGSSEIVRHTTSSSSSSFRWVHGAVCIPEEIGNAFDFTVDEFADGRHDDEAAVKRALSAYVESILAGLCAAIDVFTNPSKAPISAAGQTLRIGNVEPQLALVASSIYGSNSIPETVASAHGFEWEISQGDLFQGTLNVKSCISGMDETRYASFGANDVDADVLVKVSSSIVHRPLVSPLLAFFALKRAEGSKELQAAFSEVLHAVVETDCGLITIMNDLNYKGYRPLCPRYDNVTIRYLWDGFKELVKCVLLPMADRGIIHPDIRPGIDFTSNILWKRDGGNKAKMVLIDYESLVKISGWTCKDGAMYISPSSRWNEMTFVFWQSVAAAYAWSQDLNQYRSRAEDVMKMELFLFSTGAKRLRGLPPDLRNLLVDSKFVRTLSKVDVESVLVELDVLF